MAHCDSSMLTSVTVTQIIQNLHSENHPERRGPEKKWQFDQRGVHGNGWMRVCVIFTTIFPFHSIKPNANYWASHSVKCTAVGTVRATWTVELLYMLTVLGLSLLVPWRPPTDFTISWHPQPSGLFLHTIQPKLMPRFSEVKVTFWERIHVKNNEGEGV